MIDDTQNPPAAAPAACGAALREQVPVLQQTVRNGQRLAYLDNAATSQKPESVIDALTRYYREYNSNVHRALHQLAERATEDYEQARDRIADLVGAPHRDGVVFTRGTTEAINLVASSWGRPHLKPGDEIILSEMEHHSNLVPWQILAEENDLTLRYIRVLDDGTLDIDHYHDLLSERTRLLSITHMSNVLGTINPVEAMAREAREAGARVLVDGAQSVPHMNVDMQAIQADFLVFSGHKMMGPTGIGALVAAPDLLDSMSPYQSGGEMIQRVRLDKTTFAAVPHKFEAGTPNIAGAIGLSEAIRVLQEDIGFDALHAHENSLTAYALEQLKGVPGLTLYGEAPDRGGAISFKVDGIHPHDLSQFVDRDGVAIRAGHMCCQPLLRRFKVGALSRASLYAYNDRDDIDQLVRALNRAREFFCHE